MFVQPLWLWILRLFAYPTHYLILRTGAKLFAEFLGELNELARNIVHMKEPEYIEGPKALENFKRGMEALFRVPKTAVLRKKKQARKPATVRKKSDADKG